LSNASQPSEVSDGLLASSAAKKLAKAEIAAFRVETRGTRGIEALTQMLF